MPRPAGVRNHDFEEKRTALLETLTEFALTDDLRRPSLRQFAIAAGASEPTLRHYFGDRQGLVIAILEHINQRAQPLWSIVATGASDPEAAVEEYFRVTKAGMEHGGFARAHAFGIIEGLADTKVGDAYLKLVLRPCIGDSQRQARSHTWWTKVIRKWSRGRIYDFGTAFGNDTASRAAWWR